MLMLQKYSTQTFSPKYTDILIVKRINFTINCSLMDKYKLYTYMRNILVLKTVLPAPVLESGQKIFFSVYEHTNLSWLPVTRAAVTKCRPRQYMLYRFSICKLDYNMAAVIRKP